MGNCGIGRRGTSLTAGPTGPRSDTGGPVTGTPRTGASGSAPSRPISQRPVTARLDNGPGGKPSAAGQAASSVPAPEIVPAGSAVAGQVFKVAKFALYTIIPALMLLSIGLGVLYVRLSHGPISFDVLVPPMERGINAELLNNSVKIKGAELRLGADGALEFRLRNVSVREKDGDVVATAPLAAINISTAALWRARIVPARIELIDPVIKLLYTDENGLALSAAAELPVDGDAPEKADEQKLSSQAPGGPANEANTQLDGRAKNSGVPAAAPVKQISLARLLSDASRRARQRMGATSYLTEFGLRNATVALEYAGQKSSWQVPSVDIDFDHGSNRSVISGRATVSSARGPWSVSFLTDQSEQDDKLVVKTTVRDLVPSTLAAAAPPLAMLRMFDMGVAGDATIDLTTDGDIGKAEIAVEMGSGRIEVPDIKGASLDVTAGLFSLSFDGKDRQWRLSPSPVKWGGGNVLFSGSMRDIATAKNLPVWRFTLEGKNATIEANEFKVAPVTLDVWTAAGEIIPRQGVVNVSEFRIKGGGGEASLKGMTRAGPAGQSSRADLTISPMPLATLKALWPRAIAPAARVLVGEKVTAADFKGGKVTFASGEFLTGEAPALSESGQRLSATFEFADVVALPNDRMGQITAARALIRLENNALEIAVPDAALALPGNRRLPIKSWRLTAADIAPDRPLGEIAFSVAAPLGLVLEAIETLPVKAIADASPVPKAGEGKVDAQIKLKMPLGPNINPDEVSFEGKAKITDGRFGKIGGQFDVQGFTLAVEATDKVIDAKGDLLINGVPAKVTAQRILGADSDKQPPLKVTATLDDADRTQLGLDINDIVRGPVPVEISVQKGTRPEPAIKLKADLTNAELVIEQLAWKKAQGRSAVVEADLVSGKTHKMELQNLKVSGDDIAIEGWLGIGADTKMREFSFPQFSLNLVSRLELHGTRSNEDIWQVKAHGTNFDGRDLCRALLAVGDNGERKVKALRPAAGVDLVADVDNVIGSSDVSLRSVKLKLSSRGEKLQSLDVRGTLDGGARLTVNLDNKPGAPRHLLAESNDAGQTMKFAGFYPNLQGGHLKLEVNLDGKGPAEKTGILWAENFKVLGDSIVSEVVGSAEQSRLPGNKKNVTREVFEFDRLRAPFSIGYGQFVLEDSYLKGPLAGANVRGKVDFKTRRVNLGGTYIPLQSLNGALGGIPLLGQIISGANGEGIFGITFAVQGPMSDPQVVVNPLSIVAPGIFREMFQMTSPDPKVQVRDEKGPAKPVEERVRASSPPAGEAVQKRSPGTRPSPGKVDGWSSSTSGPGARN